MELRKFTEGDWLSFPGVEPTDDGRQPLIAWCNNRAMIVDKSGLTLISQNRRPMHALEDTPEWTYYRLRLPYEIASLLAGSMTPEALRTFDAYSGEI